MSLDEFNIFICNSLRYVQIKVYTKLKLITKIIFTTLYKVLYLTKMFIVCNAKVCTFILRK